VAPCSYQLPAAARGLYSCSSLFLYTSHITAFAQLAATSSASC
jgi:hypothetical protein